jgi:hypothetical protein
MVEQEQAVEPSICVVAIIFSAAKLGRRRIAERGRIKQLERLPHVKPFGFTEYFVVVPHGA